MKPCNVTFLLSDQPEIPEDSSSVRLLLPSVELYLVLRSAPTDEESTDDDKDSKGLLNHLDKTAQTAPIKENKCNFMKTFVISLHNFGLCYQ